ncbi:ATP-binding protein [Streptomyces tubercidicus]|uniref:ATP-binding protein n=1 Tax=Streptomyces tubercidicus TaxID=47759 RepID=UPI003757A6FC
MASLAEYCRSHELVLSGLFTERSATNGSGAFTGLLDVLALPDTYGVVAPAASHLGTNAKPRVGPCPGHRDHVRPAMMDTTQKFFAAKPESISLARDFAAMTLKAWGLDAPADNVRLCVSELASNALLHGTKRGHGFLVRLDADEDFVRLEVHDSRDRRGGREPQPAIQHPADTDTTGRGLRIVDILADGWGVEDREPLGKIVWSRFKAGFPGSQDHLG